MATKTVTKKVVKKAAKKAPAKPPALSKAPQQYAMPAEVKAWIERATSIMNHQKGEIERLKRENTEMKQWRLWAESRILRSEHES